MKRLISLTAAIALMISIINISVSALGADTVYVMSREVYEDTCELLEDFGKGDIPYVELVSELGTMIENATLAGLDYEASKLTRLLNGIERSHGGSEHGGGGSGESRSPISDIWDDICNGHNVPTETTQTSTTDMLGAGAKVVWYSNGSPTSAYTYDYLVIYTSGDRRLMAMGSVCKYYECKNGSYIYKYDVSVPAGGARYGYPPNGYKYYGDVRYADGSAAPTDDEFVYGTLRKFDELDDKEINDLINDFGEEIERQNPDLSTVEGLLNAIYARLGRIDSDDDGAMLSAINAAIISLASDNRASSAEVVELLKELKNKKAEGADLDPILNELKDVNKSLDYLKTINTLDLIGDTIETLLELTDSERAFLDEYAGIILSLTAKFGYAPVTAMISNLEAIIFNGNPPQDIVTTIYDTQVILLSSSAFDSLQITSALNLAKLFVSVLLAISWLYAMRKKITGGA